MIKFILTFFTVCSVLGQLCAQNSATPPVILKGLVVDKETSQPLAYTCVGILNKPLGTVADTTGQFSFEINTENLADTLQISIVGYSTIRVSVKDFMSGNQKTFNLIKKPVQLAEVTIVNSDAASTEIVGRQAVSKAVQISIHNKKDVSATVGSEMGMLYKPNKKSELLKNFNFYISANNFNYIKFRVNIYNVKNGLPSTLLWNKQIFASIDNFKTGWTSIDLTPYHIQISGEFIITVQWVESRMEKKENPVTIVPVSLSLFSKNCYVRVASQDKWKKMGVNLSNYVTLAY